MDVMELQERALRASVSAFGYEATLAAITLRDRTLDMARDIPLPIRLW
jgi:hypothetical protein